jgi:glycosyltransferase involved in cell wall biosynthesis
VDFFGQDMGDLHSPYPCTDHGILSADELGGLYREAAVGLVFSATNYSISTREMMACGLPVLDLDIESVRAVYPPDVLTLAAPNPPAIAQALDRLLGDAEHRAAQARAAAAYVGQFSWEASARLVERALQERVVR